jgi:uncharacterized protein YegP (UPF0339 family)
MGKLFRAAVLFAAIGAVMSAGSLSSPALGQAKKKAPVVQKDEVGVTEVYKAKDGWRFRIKNTAGKSVAIGTVGFDTKEDAEKMVDFVRTTLGKGKVNVLKEEKK